MLSILLVIALGFILFGIAGFTGAVWVPAFSKDVTRICRNLRIKPGTKVYEFGCGDGRFLRLVAQRGASAVGYEINPIMACIAKLLSLRANIDIKIADAWTQPFHDADIVFVFLMPEYMERIGNKMKAELKPGTILVTYVYPVPQLEHYLHEANAYFYKIPS